MTLAEADRQRLTYSLGQLRETGNQTGYFGAFVELSSIFTTQNASGGRFGVYDRYTGSLFWELARISSVVKRLDWEFYLWKNGEISDGIWMAYATSDIELFHVKLRSAFDTVAQLIVACSSLDPGQKKKLNSFRVLYQKVIKDITGKGFIARLGADLALPVKQCDWFMRFRGTRDLITHRDGLTLVFPDRRGIAFQVYKYMLSTIRIPEVMLNANVADFILYGGLHMGFFIEFLDQVSQMVAKTLTYPLSSSSAQMHFVGLEVVHQWINRASEL
jgi:hypothetical protein